MNHEAFQTQYSRRAETRIYASVGSPVVTEYVAERDPDGVLQLCPAGEHDLYEDIQSHAASCDLQVIINRYFSGDPGALSRVQGVYADMSGMPSSIHEVYNLMERAHADFATLPVEVKERFGNDPVQFLSTLGSSDWLEKMQVEASSPDTVDLVDNALEHAAAVRESEVLG